MAPCRPWNAFSSSRRNWLGGQRRSVGTSEESGHRDQSCTRSQTSPYGPEAALTLQEHLQASATSPSQEDSVGWGRDSRAWLPAYAWSSCLLRGQCRFCRMSVT